MGAGDCFYGHARTADASAREGLVFESPSAARPVFSPFIYFSRNILALKFISLDTNVSVDRTRGPVSACLLKSHDGRETLPQREREREREDGSQMSNRKLEQSQ